VELELHLLARDVFRLPVMLLPPLPLLLPLPQVLTAASAAVCRRCGQRRAGSPDGMLQLPLSACWWSQQQRRCSSGRHC
jgi:hypothetical protein